MPKHTLDHLKQNLDKPGWRTVTGDSSTSLEGTLRDTSEAAHDRRKNGHAVGYLQEIETEIEVDMLQLQELWYHLGLPAL